MVSEISYGGMETFLYPSISLRSIMNSSSALVSFFYLSDEGKCHRQICLVLELQDFHVATGITKLYTFYLFSSYFLKFMFNLNFAEFRGMEVKPSSNEGIQQNFVKDGKDIVP